MLVVLANTPSQKGLYMKQLSDQTFRVEEPAALLPFLREKLAGKPAGKVKSILKHGLVSVDGRPTTKYNLSLRHGQTVTIASYRPDPPAGSAAASHPPILYEDRELLVIDKPAGLLTINTGGSEPEETAYRQMTEYVRRKNPESRIFIVHRLDRDTSGVVLFAKNPEIKTALQDNWDQLVQYRGYYAIVEGRMEQPSGRLSSWLKETRTHLVYSSRRAGDGKPAVTNYEVLRQNPDYSYLRVWLETGRKNQIRVQMQEIGHPVTGDKKYGAQRDPLKRLGLHAWKLELTHPVSGKRLDFTAEPPKKMSEFLLIR